MPRRKWYGSVNNRLMEEGTQMATPEVGSGATIILWSDRNPARVTKVLSPSRVEITAVPVTEWKNDYGVAFGEPAGNPVVVTRRSDGVWKIAGSTTVVRFAKEPSAYYDRSF